MGNLSNSFVRGFGWGLGRSAASALTSKSKTTAPVQSTFSKKQLALIQENEDIKSKFESLLNESEESYKNGKMTEIEINILRTDINKSMIEIDGNIAKLKSVSESKGGSPWIFITLVVIAIWVIVKLSH